MSSVDGVAASDVTARVEVVVAPLIVSITGVDPQGI